MANYNGSKELRDACFILKARMMNTEAIKRYENRDDWYSKQWNDMAKDVWNNHPWSKR